MKVRNNYVSKKNLSQSVESEQKHLCNGRYK
nr:MAG TPA: hypothetical protein [Caudoviricetes sp.]